MHHHFNYGVGWGRLGRSAKTNRGWRHGSGLFAADLGRALGDAVDQAGAHPVEFGELGPLLSGLGRGPWRSWPEIPTSSTVSNARTTPGGGHSSTRSSTTSNGSCWNSAQGCAFYGRQRGPRRRRSGVLPRPPLLPPPRRSPCPANEQRARSRTERCRHRVDVCYPILLPNPHDEPPSVGPERRIARYCGRFKSEVFTFGRLQGFFGMVVMLVAG